MVASSSRSSSPPRRQRACFPCSKAKARCNFPENEVTNGCDRCRRIKIECSAQTTKVLRRPRQLKPTSNSNPVGSLEHKLDGITSLLDSGSARFSTLSDPTEAGADDSSLGTPPSIPTPEYFDRNSFHSYGLGAYAFGGQPYDDPSYSVHVTHPEYGHHAHPHSHHHTHQHPALDDGAAASTPSSPGFGLTWDHANQALSLFKAKFTPEFPFVALDLEVTAAQLYLEKPLLFRVILMVAAPITLAKQREMRRSISAYIGQHLVVLGERDLDLLQGLLVFIAWGNHSSYLDREITHLIYLAVGFAHNLGITRYPASSRERVKQAVSPDDFNTMADGFHSLEEMRAFLGCYYLLSVNSSQFSRNSSMLRSDYIDFCLNFVAQAAEHWTDSTLEKMVRLQQVVDQISQTFPSSAPSTSGGDNGIQNLAQVMADEVQPLRAQIDKICETFTHEQAQSATLWLHYNYALVRLYEPATWPSAAPPQPSSPSATTQQQQQQQQYAFLRSQYLLYCLQAAKAFVTVHLGGGVSVGAAAAMTGVGLGLAEQQQLARPFVAAAQLVHVLVTAARLLLLQADHWDLVLARQTLDLPRALDQLAAVFARAGLLRRRRALDAAAATGSGKLPDQGEDSLDDQRDDVSARYVDKIRWIRAWYHGRLVQGAGVPAEFHAQPPHHQHQQPQQQLSADELVLPEDVWSLGENSGNQFWLGLTGGNNWMMEY